jgi:hypothetical protein
MTSPLLKSAFPGGTQKGPKKGEGSGNTQHGELANSETPKPAKKVKGVKGSNSAAKPKAPKDVEGKEAPAKSAKISRRAGDHSVAKVLTNYSGALTGKPSMESPMEKIQRDAHESKVRATRQWMDGDMTTEQHDEVHRRANAVLKHRGRRP